MIPASTSAWQLEHRSMHLLASDLASANDLVTPRWLSEKRLSAGSR